jgi:hypothetical protein
VVLLSIITATIPRTNTFWVSLQTGKSGAIVTEYELSGSRSQGNTLANEAGTGGLSSKSQARSQADEPSLRGQNAHLRLIPRSANKVSTKIFAAGREAGGDETELVAGRAPVGGLEDDDRSQKSLRPGGGLGIYRNTEVSVVEEHVSRRGG